MTVPGLGEPAAGRVATARAEARPLVGQRRVRRGPAVVETADQRRVRHPGVGDEDLVEECMARHLLERTDVDTVLEHVEGEVRDALVLGHVGVGAGEQHAEVGVLAARGPHLLAVDDPLVAVLDGAGLQAGQVRTGLGLAEQLAPRLLARHDVAHVEVDLLLRAVGGDRRRGQEEAQPGRRTESAELGHFLLDQHDIGTGHGAAVGVGRQTRGRPTRETQAFPPLGDRQVGVPVAAQPGTELAQLLVRAGRLDCGISHVLRSYRLESGRGDSAHPGGRPR